MGQLKFVVSILFIAIFTVAVVAYVSNFATDNNANINLGDDEAFTTVNSSLRGQMVVFSRDINDSSSGLTQSTAAPAADVFKSPSVFQNLRFTRDSVSTVLELMRTKVFGGNPAFFIVIATISTFLVFKAVVYIYKTFKSGDPD